jgi:hypothetical protein
VSTVIEYSCQITLAFASPTARCKTELSGVTVPGLFYIFIWHEIRSNLFNNPDSIALERYGGYYRFRDRKGFNTKYCWENTKRIYLCKDYRKGERKGEIKGRRIGRRKVGNVREKAGERKVKMQERLVEKEGKGCGKGRVKAGERKVKIEERRGK